MAGTMYDYLTTATPDYATTTLNISPSTVIPEKGGRKVTVNEADDGSRESICLTDSSLTFIVTLQWEFANQSDMSTLFDFYFDPTKANGVSKTFKWYHVMDGHTYVARFIGEFTREWYSAYSNVKSIQLQIVGRIA